ncbi:CNBD2 [Branchiostoma lanceolatum]|uniref:CNBD2 protein n=1 Tax=Branchiostoma lanceolatum TaxID=7740 RepID=A0A8K0F3P8_BRALA|nr:CNBD2 [Branchiostoma lanceolatum]
MLALPEEGVTEEEDDVTPLPSRRPSRQDVPRRRLRRFSVMEANADVSSHSSLQPQLRKHSSVGPGINVRRRSSIGGQLLAGGQRSRRHSLAASALAIPGRSPNSGPGGKHQLWGLLRRKSSLYFQQTALQLLRKFRRAARVVLACVHLNRLCQAVQRIKDNEADTVSYLPSSFARGGLDNFTGVDNLMFNKADYKADRDSLRLSEMSRAVLMSPPADRTDEQIEHVLVELRRFKTFSQNPISMQKTFCKFGFYQSYGPKRAIVRQGQISRLFYVIISGSVTTWDADTHMLTVQELRRPGDTFGELTSTAFRKKRQTSIISRADIELLSISVEDLVDRATRMPPENTVVSAGDFVKSPFLRGLDFLQDWPVGVLEESPDSCMFQYALRGSVLTKDSQKSDWIYVITTGSCTVLKELKLVQVTGKKRGKRKRSVLDDSEVIDKFRQAHLSKSLPPLSHRYSARKTVERTKTNKQTTEPTTTTTQNLEKLTDWSARSLTVDDGDPRRTQSKLSDISEEKDSVIGEKKDSQTNTEEPVPAIQVTSASPERIPYDTPLKKQLSVRLPSLVDPSDVNTGVNRDHAKGMDEPSKIPKLPVLEMSRGAYFVQTPQPRPDGGKQVMTSRRDVRREDKPARTRAKAIVQSKLQQTPKTMDVISQVAAHNRPRKMDRLRKLPQSLVGKKRVTSRSNKSQLPSLTKTRPAPTENKSVFVTVKTLGKGAVFGLSDFLFDEQPSLILVSNGAECVMISKKLYRRHANDELLRKLRTQIYPFPSEQELQQNLRDYVDWEAYRNNTYSGLVRSAQRRREKKQQYTVQYMGQECFR